MPLETSEDLSFADGFSVSCLQAELDVHVAKRVDDLRHGLVDSQASRT
jgi:hypothetical protein